MQDISFPTLRSRVYSTVAHKVLLLSLFQIEVLPNSEKQLLATWTSPGDDYDHGSVAGYKIVYSDNITDLLEDR